MFPAGIGVKVKGSKEYKDFIRKYMNEHSVPETMEYFGWSYVMTHKIAKDLDVHLARKPRGPGSRKRLRAQRYAFMMNKDNMTIQEIAEQDGCTKQNVSLIMKVCGYKRAWVSEAMFQEIVKAQKI